MKATAWDPGSLWKARADDTWPPWWRLIGTLGDESGDVLMYPVEGPADLSWQGFASRSGAKLWAVRRSDLTEHFRRAPLCDFCGWLDPRWEFVSEATRLTVEAIMEDLSVRRSPTAWTGDEFWAACDGCAAAIERRDREGLAARTVESPTYLGAPHRGLLEAADISLRAVTIDFQSEAFWRGWNGKTRTPIEPEPEDT